MKQLLLRQSSTQVWQALIQESAVKAQVCLNETLESYLVFLLMRFARDSALVDSVFALDYLQLQQMLLHQRQTGLRDLGDKCLLFAGLYPGNATRKHVKVDYFIRLGRTAYADLSMLTQDSLSQLYSELSCEFIGLMEVLFASWDSEHGNRLLPDELQTMMQFIQQRQPCRRLQ